MSESNEESQHVVYSSSILFEKQPIEAMESLVIRRQQAKQINKELSEWLTSYGRLKLHYVDELKKIHKTGQELFTNENVNLQNSKLDALGLLNPIWNDTLKIINNEIELFDQSTRKMGRDMIAPLRLFTRNNDLNLIEMDQLIEIASNLKNGQNGHGNLNDFENEWSTKAPYFFEIFENYDYQRLLLLKDVFLKYQTDVADVVNQFKKDNENGLQHVLNFNVDDEINRFANDVIKTNLPVENIKVEAVSKSRNTTDGFTFSPSNGAAIGAGVGGAIAGAAVSKRHSSLLSSHRFHLKKNNDHDSPSSSNISTNESKRLSSNTSMLSSNTSSTFNDNKKKEKGAMRSKFGSIFKGRKKNGKDSTPTDFTPPSTIHEPDNSSINTEVTNPRDYSSNRQRNQSIASQSLASVKHYSSNNNIHNSINNHNDYNNNANVAPPNVPKDEPQNQHPYRQSSIAEPVNKPLPQYPLSETVHTEEPKSIEQQQQQASAPNPAVVSTFVPVEQPQQAEQLPIIEQKQVEPSFYEPMRPTRRSDSLSGSSVPQVDNLSVSNSTLNTPPASSTTGVTSIPPTAYNMNIIPEASQLSNNNNAPAPPPPSSRKHVSTDPSVPAPSSVSNLRQPRNSVPVPPTQRKSMLIEQQPLQPAPTGTQRSESVNSELQRNTTGGGGLVSGAIIHPSLTTAGFNASIVELFNATFKDGLLTRSNAIGEVAFSFISNDEKKLPSELSLKVSSKNENVKLPNFAVNTLLMNQVNEDTFIISDPTQISMRTVGALKYMLNDTKPPIIVTPVWKHEANQSTVCISIKPTNELDEYLTTGSLTLTNFIVSVSIKDALVSSAATKPPGSLNKEKGRVTWIVKDPITFNSTKKEERFIARFKTTKLAKESDSGVQIKFNISNEDGAGRIDFINTDLEIQARGETVVEDPFGDGLSKQVDDWSDVPTLKTIVAGSYSGHSNQV